MAGEPDMMLTLTCNPSAWSSKIDARRGMQLAFKHLIKRIIRHKKLKTLEYFLVVEACESGWPHFHVLLRAPYIKQKWISRNWRELTSAHIVDVRRLKNQRHAAWYVTKYISSAPARFGKMKRFWHSRHWSRQPKLVPAHDWKRAETRVLKPIDLASLIVAIKASAWSIERTGPDGLEITINKSGVPPPLWECGREAEPRPRRRQAHDYAAAA